MSDAAPRARDRLALALDFAELDAARRLAEECAPWFATVKVGLELYVAAGPDAVSLLRRDGFFVFVDLKLHDIPATVQRASAGVARLGAAYATVHAAGGAEMLEAAVAGFAEGSEDSGAPATIGLGVTALTSEDASPSLVSARAELIKRAGLGGVVCAVGDLGAVRHTAPGLVTVVPGIRPAGVPAHDQRRVGTPADAVRSGADLLVVGRPVREAADPARAAAEIAAQVAEAAMAEILVDEGGPR